MFKYTICFIQQGNNILMLNREKSSWMGSWNGVGGKVELGESPEEGIIREIREETGLMIENVNYRGIVTWYEDGADLGGMYAFTVQLAESEIYETPIKTREGILDWKKLDWLCHPENSGVAHNVPYFLPSMLSDKDRFEYRCLFKKGYLVNVEKRPLQEKDYDAHQQKKIALYS